MSAHQTPDPRAAAQFLPKTIEGLETAIQCNNEIALQYEAKRDRRSLKWAAHHRARVDACEAKIQRMIEEQEQNG